MTEADLPEEIIENIISRLPVKSLLRFTSVSKRWRSIILFDTHFANQFQRNKTLLTRRVLVYSAAIDRRDYRLLESLDLETSSIRSLNFSFRQQPGYSATLLGSCNGLVFIAYHNVVFVYNPSTGFVKELPLPDYSKKFWLGAYGAGYLPATDDYKVFGIYEPQGMGDVRLCEMISLKDQIWRSIDGPEDCDIYERRGTLVNEALQWVGTRVTDEIIAFDLAMEEFRKMKMPNFRQDGKHGNNFLGCLGGCLCLLRCPAYEYSHSVDFDIWVMREYQVTESWIKLYHLRFTNQQGRLQMWPVLITENHTVSTMCTGNEKRVIRINHKQQEEESSFDILDGGRWYGVIEYEESLVSIGG